MIKVGINGFGRIGRAIFRNNLLKNYFEVVAINDINPDINNIAYTLNFDTLYDRLDSPFKVEGNRLISKTNNSILVTHHNKINLPDWEDVDLVIDSSGIYENAGLAKVLTGKGKIKKVLVTHCPNNVDFTMVLGANESQYNPKLHHVISSSICDATAIAPVLKVIHDKYKIQCGMITTLHPWLNYQNLMDGPASSWSVPGEIYHHYALGRASIGNMIPKPTSAINATCKVLPPEINEEILGSFSYRTPTAIVGSADISLQVRGNATREETIEIFNHYERNQKWSIIHNNIEPLVSLDFKKMDYSTTVDHRWTDVKVNHLIKLVLWYDNEWGYAGKVIDQVKYIEEYF